MNVLRWKHEAHLDDCWILLAALDELVEGQFGVLIPVHVLEDLVHSLLFELCHHHLCE